jgi:tetratricopeptide (TPR) repeat protein
MMAGGKSAVRTVVVACMLAWMTLAAALCQTGQITGAIKDADGKVIPGAAAVLFSQDGGTELKRAVVDASGRYEFASLANGSYRIGASASGYQDATLKLIILTGATRTIDLTLTAAQGAGKEGSGNAAEDKRAKQPLAFTPAGVRGTIAPSGYSTGLSSEETAQVNHNVSELGTDLLYSLLPTGTAAECSHEPELLHAVQKDPRSFRANRELGLFYLRHGDYVHSAEYLKAAKAMSPTDDENGHDLAVALLGANRAAEAVAQLESLAVRHSRDASFVQLLALAYERAGDAEKARAAYLEAVALDAGAATGFDCGMGLIRLGALDEARKLLSAATSAHPEAARLWMALGIADNLQEHKAAAVQWFLRAIEKDPDYEPTYSFVANLAASVPGTEAEIRKRLAEFVVRHPGSAVAHLDYALAMWKQHGRDPSVASDAEIIAQLKIVLASEPNLSRAHFVLGDVYADGGYLANAEQEFRAVVELEPENAQAHYRLSQIYRKQGRSERAATEISEFRLLHGKPGDNEIPPERNLQAISFHRVQGAYVPVQCPPVTK